MIFYYDTKLKAVVTKREKNELNRYYKIRKGKKDNIYVDIFEVKGMPYYFTFSYLEKSKPYYKTLLTTHLEKNGIEFENAKLVTRELPPALFDKLTKGFNK